MNTSHAPCVNFVMVTISSTKTVIAAPSELMTSPMRAERRSAAADADPRRGIPTRVAARAAIARQCRTMPICPSENDTKTPMM